MILNNIKYFYPEKPQLILINSDAFEEMSNDPDFVAEPKFNEQRCELRMINGHFEFWDRHGKLLKYNDDYNHKEEREEIEDVFRNTFGVEGYFAFDTGLRHNKVIGIQNKLVIYDMHIRNGQVLNKIPFMRRRYLLEGYFGNWEYDISKNVHLINQHKNNFQRVYDDYVNGEHGNPDEFEGLVMKNLNGKLKLGRVSGADSLWMFKVRKQTGRHRY